MIVTADCAIKTTGILQYLLFIQAFVYIWHDQIQVIPVKDRAEPLQEWDHIGSRKQDLGHLLVTNFAARAVHQQVDDLKINLFIDIPGFISRNFK